MSDWQDFDLDRTIHDYDYTRRAVCKMNRIMDSSEFESMDADAIFRYLSDEMDVVIFPDFLKRYIYEHAEIDAPFADVPDSVYQEIISDAFADNKAPLALTETRTRKSLIIKRWLSQNSIRRDTVFTLGFGLKMLAEDVSMFLTKVLKEEDFDFSDPEETILWFCYKRGLPYLQYRKLAAQYAGMSPAEDQGKVWNSMTEAPEIFLDSPGNLQTYLQMLKTRNISEQKEQTAFEEFMTLYDRCREIIAGERNRSAEFADGEEPVRPEDISPADLERELCSGIPFNSRGNLEVMARSRFSALFEQKRMSRQRLATILNRTRPVDRFDLITLQFFIYAETVEPNWPAERYLRYIDGVNEILHRCGMADIYPVNPYEAFVLMCIVTDFPLDVYAEIWERSYE